MKKNSKKLKLHWLLDQMIWSIPIPGTFMLFVLIDEIVSGHITWNNIFTDGIMLIFFPVACTVMFILSLRQGVTVDLKKEVLTYSNYGLKKETIPLCDVQRLSADKDINGTVIFNIIEKNGDMHECYGLSFKPFFTNNKDNLLQKNNILRRSLRTEYYNENIIRYGIFIDKVNAILEEKY